MAVILRTISVSKYVAPPKNRSGRRGVLGRRRFATRFRRRHEREGHRLIAGSAAPTARSIAARRRPHGSTRPAAAPQRVVRASAPWPGRGIWDNGDCGTSSKRSFGSRTDRIGRRDRRAPPCGRPRSLSAPSFAQGRVNLQTLSGKPGRGGGKYRPAPTGAFIEQLGHQHREVGPMD